jgi:Membrane protease subunits, stomatin/prohibitin homologs
MLVRLVEKLLNIDYVTVREAEVGLLYEDGRYVRTLGPGRHRVTGRPWSGKQEVVRVDRRRQSLAVQGQEMLTADSLSVRLNVAAEYRVVDAATALHTAQSYAAALYSALQLVLRDEVQARTLDELLADRSALSAELRDRVRPEAEALGLELVSAGVKDIVLPGDVKRMLSQEIEAQRAGRAALTAAREETAAMRAKANTARLLSESPMLLRLREIEALTDVGKGSGNTVVLAVPAELMSSALPLAGKGEG